MEQTYEEGDRVTTRWSDSTARIIGVRDGRYCVRWDNDGSTGYWKGEDLRLFEGEWETPEETHPQTYPLGLQCGESIIPEVINPMDPIVSMLILTNLPERLGIPQPCDVDLEWDSPEYLLLILWRVDSLLHGMGK